MVSFAGYYETKVLCDSRTKSTVNGLRVRLQATGQHLLDMLEDAAGGTLSSMTNCFLCGRLIQEVSNFIRQEGAYCITCRQCGFYSVDNAVSEMLRSSMEPALSWKAPLSCATRQAYESNTPVLITRENAEVLATSHRHTRISENSERLLQVIAKRAKRPNEWAVLSLADDFTLIDCFSKEEFDWYVRRLMDEELISRTSQQGAGADSFHTRLTMKGWIQAQPLARPGGSPGHCFVAMWFSPETQAAYDEGIIPAVEKAIGRKPLRIDQKEHNNEITDEIMSEIRNAQFVVADFTGQRAGVYYEAGYAMGLGRPVIFTCKQDDLTNLHFDTNHRNHIVWHSPVDLRDKLYRRIRATILDLH